MEERITFLELELARHAAHVAELSKALFAQQQQLELFRRALQQMNKQAGVDFVDPTNEKPPHY